MTATALQAWIAGIGALLAGVLGILKYFSYRTRQDRISLVGQAFNSTVEGLSSDAESILSADLHARDLAWFGDRFGQRAARGCLSQSPVRPVPVAGRLVLAQSVQEVALVPDQGAIEELAPAGLYPALHDRVHSGHPDTALDDLQPGIIEDGVERVGELGVAVADQEFRRAAGVFQVHDQVPPELRGPGGRGVRGGAEDPDPPGGVLDDGEGVQARPGQGADLEEVTGQQGVGLTAQEAGPGQALPSGCGRDAVLVQDLPDGGGGDLDAEGREFAVDAPVSPGGVLAGQGQDESADRADGARAPAALRPAGRGMAPLIRSRCQRSSVSGRTSSRSWRSFPAGRWWSSPASTMRSVWVNAGLPTWRCRTMSWCRSARIPFSFSCSLMGSRRMSVNVFVRAR